MSAGRYNLTIEQGATWAEDLLWEVDDAPVDLTGASAVMQIRQAPTAGGALLAALTSDDGSILLGGDAGSIGLRLSAALTAALPAGSALYNLEITIEGIVVRLLEGRVTINPTVNHS